MKFQAKMVSKDSISVIIDGKPYVVGSDHSKFRDCEKAVKANDTQAFMQLYGSTSLVKAENGFEVTESILVGHDRVTYKGHEVHNTVCLRIIEMQRDGHDTKPLCKFLEKLLKNPSKWCVDALYKFLEAKGLPITEDGNVLGYKAVTHDWKDKYSKTIDNHIGAEPPPFPRNMVDDDRTIECSRGYHIGDLSYSGPNGNYYNKSDGDHIIICEFSPEDVVSVPEEAAAHKIRVCKYKVVSEYVQDLPDIFHNLTIEQLKPGDLIEFSILVDNPYYENEYDDELYEVIIRMKFEGISKRSKGTRFYGRILKGSEYGIPGSSASYLISEVSDIRKV